MSTKTSPIDIPWAPYIPHVPTPKQHAFLWLMCKEAFFGGAAGGGKSDALLMAALQFVQVPDYAAIIFRRSYTDLNLPGAIMSRAEQWLAGSDAKWNANDHEWTFPSGAKLVFSYLQRPNDKYRYQSADFQFIGFDELTHFPEDDYTYLASRLRRPSAGPLSQVPLRIRGAANPGGVGHRWVKERFVDGRNEQRVFIPAGLEDNPHLDQESYEASLELLDPITHAQLRHGDWSIRPPGMYVFDHNGIGCAEELGRLVDLGQIKFQPVDDKIYSGIDFGDFATVLVPIMEVERGGVVVPSPMVQTSRASLEDITDDFFKVMDSFPYWWAQARYDSSFAQSAKTFASLAQKRKGINNIITKKGRPGTYPVSFGHYKMLAIKYTRILLKNSMAAVEALSTGGIPDLSRCLVISPKNKLLIDQLNSYVEDEFGKPQKGDDDAVDAMLAGVTPLARKHRVLVETLEAQAHKQARLQPNLADGVPPLTQEQAA